MHRHRRPLKNEVSNSGLTHHIFKAKLGLQGKGGIFIQSVSKTQFMTANDYNT